MAARQKDRNNEQPIIKTCAPFISCITEINNTHIDNAKDLVTSMYNLIECNRHYSHACEGL